MMSPWCLVLLYARTDCFLPVFSFQVITSHHETSACFKSYYMPWGLWSHSPVKRWGRTSAIRNNSIISMTPTDTQLSFSGRLRISEASTVCALCASVAQCLFFSPHSQPFLWRWRIKDPGVVLYLISFTLAFTTSNSQICKFVLHPWTNHRVHMCAASYFLKKLPELRVQDTKMRIYVSVPRAWQSLAALRGTRSSSLL